MDLASLDPDELLRRVSAAGLRGRGGGWYPAARKWQAVRVEGGDPIVIANGAEGEPGAIKDRWLMLTRPDDVVAGLVLAARAVRAREAVLYLKGSFEAQAQALEGALNRANPALDVRVVRGEDTYVAGEETAILEVLEGRRAWPREKPPYPAGVGLHGRPTLIQNVETLARVPAAVADPDRFRADETTLVSLWGDVRRPGVYDVPLGTKLTKILDDQGQGTTEEPGWLFPAGPSAAPLRATPANLDLPLDPEALKAVGTALGSAALLVVGASANPLTLARSLAAFFERESCGQCPPCVVGSRSLLKVTRALEKGEARAADLRHLQEAAGFMRPHGYCAHSRTAANAVTAMLDRAKDAVAARLGGNEPAGRQATPFEPDSRERAAIEQVLATTWRKRAG